jgi:hypothetical protein
VGRKQRVDPSRPHADRRTAAAGRTCHPLIAFGLPEVETG